MKFVSVLRLVIDPMHETPVKLPFAFFSYGGFICKVVNKLSGILFIATERIRIHSKVSCVQKKCNLFLQFLCLSLYFHKLNLRGLNLLI